MSEMTKTERVSAVLSGERPDRPPVSLWHHFAPEQTCGRPAVDAHLRLLERFDLDFLKVMNDNPFPVRRKVARATDLRDLPILEGDEEGFGAQLDVLAVLARELSGQVFLTTTVFNAWAVLRRMVIPKRDNVHRPPTLGGGPLEPDLAIHELIAEDRSAVADALKRIAASLANFARRCLDAGADGIYLSVRDDWVDTQEHGLTTYDEIVRPCDRALLAGAEGGRFNVLHVCGMARNFDAFAAYPVHVINWADRAAGPSIREVIDRVRPVVCAGVDNLKTLPMGTPEDVRREVADALEQAGDRPIIVGPGCTFDPQRVAPENLDAMVNAVRKGCNADDRRVGAGGHARD